MTANGLFRWTIFGGLVFLGAFGAMPSCGAAADDFVLASDLEADIAGPSSPAAEVEIASETLAVEPTWTVNAGFISLAHSSSNTLPAFAVYDSSLYEAFNSSTADLGGASGPDITLRRRLGPNWDVEARYFQVDGWNVDHVVHDPNGMIARGYHGIGEADTFSLNNQGQLYNIEVNLRNRRFERCPLIVGFRTMQLHERFHVVGYNPMLLEGPTTQTNNFLWGCQIGAEPVLWQPSDWFRLSGLVKTGIYGGHSYQRTVVPAHLSSLEDYRGSVPFSAELGLTGQWTFSEHWSVGVGFELMWITNMALAMDQSMTVACGPPISGGIYNRSTALFGGVTVNLECRY